MAYRVVYQTDSFIDCFDVDDIQDGIDCVRMIYSGWIEEFSSDRCKRIKTPIYDDPDLSDDWDHMIFSCCASVQEPSGQKSFVIWEPDGMELAELGWMSSDELKEAYE